MKEIFVSVDRSKFQMLCCCMMFILILSASTTGILVYWALGFPSSFPVSGIVQLVLVWAGAVVVFAYTVSICCLRTEKEVELAARRERIIQNLQNQIKEMENESA